MSTKKELDALDIEDEFELEQGNQDEGLDWLLDMDDSGGGDNLFDLDDDFEVGELSEFEAQLAARPMSGNGDDGDDLSKFVSEEIVISSDTAANDIFGSAESEQSEELDDSGARAMAVEFSRNVKSTPDSDASVDEGTDVLGLASEDDMGETPMSIKRVQTEPKKKRSSKAAKTTRKKAATTSKVKTTEAKGKTDVAAEDELTVGTVANDAQSLAAAAGADVSAGDSTGETSPKLGDLDEAPTPSQVADADKLEVANEGGAALLQGTDSLGGLDDEEFDDFLANAEDLSASDADLDDLTVGEFDDVLSVDTSIDVELDLHEDFDLLGDLPRDSVEEIAALIPTVIQQVHQAAEQRLVALGMNSKSLRVDAMMAADSAATQQCLSEGYAPVTEIMADIPETLGSLPDQERGSVYVRLVCSDMDENWNHLFGAEFGAAQQSDSEVVEDVFGGDLSEDFGDELKDGEDGFFFDIDDAFSTLSQAEEDQSGEICGVDLESFGEETEAPPLVDEADSTASSEQPQKIELSASADSSDLSWCIPEHIKFSKSTQSGGDIFADFLDAFIEEGSAEVEKLEELISEWEKNPDNKDLFARVGRTLHTIKGIAKGVGLQRYGTLIHNFETLLDSLPHPDAAEEQVYFRILNVWLDALVRGLDFVKDERQDIASELPLVGREGTAVEVPTDGDGKVSAAASEEDKRIDQQLADEGAKALATQQSVRITSEKLDHLLNLASQTQQLCVRASQTTTRNKRSTTELQSRLSSVRTHIGKIADRALLSVNARGNGSSEMDALEMDQYSELQEAASILREGVEDLADLVEVVSRQNSHAEILLKQQSTVISSIAGAIQGARVVPVSRMMPGLRRIVRTVSTDLGKVVSFNVLNEVGSLDRDHYARLQVVLEHMVRNALDHGIESPEERLSSGKPESGRITVDVQKSGGNYVIKLSDDGRGIDPDMIRESAFDKGIDVDVDAMSDEEALDLIFHKGFSTASKVSEVSGRGVGMDIVITELHELGGDIQIKSTVSKGTTFEIKVPSSVTVNGALMVAAGGRSYAIPLNGLIAIEQVPADEYFEAVKNGGTLSLSDMECAPAYLATLCEGVALPERSFWETFVPVIIAGTEDHAMAIAIDSVQEALELVVRSLGSQFATVPGLAGAATTSDGEAIVALDLNLFVESVGVAGAAPVEVREEDKGTLLALVVDDSRTQRMVATSQLDTVGVETVTAENGQVAIDLLNATHRLPDVVLLDVEMPVKDGIETLREIRKSRRYGHIPVVMVTSRTGTKHRALAKEAGCNAYMGKPFNFPALVEQINVLTGHNLQLT